MKKVLSVLALLFALSACDEASFPPELHVAQFRNGSLPYAAYAGMMTDMIITSGYKMVAPGDSYTVGDTGPECRMLLRADLEGCIPATAKVDSAVLTLYVAEVSGDAAVEAYAVTTSWNTTASWVNADSTVDPTVTWASVGGDIADSPFAKLDGFVAGTRVDIPLSAALVESWIREPALNYGILLKKDVLRSEPYVKFDHIDTTVAANAPILTVAYSF